MAVVMVVALIGVALVAAVALAPWYAGDRGRGVQPNNPVRQAGVPVVDRPAEADRPASRGSTRVD